MKKISKNKKKLDIKKHEDEFQKNIENISQDKNISLNIDENTSLNIDENTSLNIDENISPNINEVPDKGGWTDKHALDTEDISLSESKQNNNKSENNNSSLKVKFLNFIHFIVFLLFISIPFYPYKYIKICIFIPWIMAVIWVIFKGCPLNKYTDNEDGSFVYELLKIPFPNIDRKLVIELITLISVSIVLSCYIRICLKENINIIDIGRARN